MKYMKRANIYKAKNVTFDPTKQEAISYDWWSFTKLVNGALIYNSYNYSATTCKHQSKVMSLLHTLGIEIDHMVSAPCGLQRPEWITQAFTSYDNSIDELMTKLKSPRRKKALDDERILAIERLRDDKAKLIDIVTRGE